MKNLYKRNVRDIGKKYQDVTIRPFMLIRGKSIAKFTREEVDFLKNELKVKTIIDLRSGKESDSLNSYKREFNFYSQPVFDGLLPGMSHVEGELTIDTIEQFIPEMDVLYYQILHGEALENLARTVRFIVNLKEEDYSVYFHCAEGKDRTGLLAAILLMILGVSDKEIVEDYLLTNRVNRKKAYLYYLGAKYIKHRKNLAYKLRRIYVAKKEYIEVLFKVIKDEYLTKENFFYKAMKLSDEEIANFRKKLIVL